MNQNLSEVTEVIKELNRYKIIDKTNPGVYFYLALEKNYFCTKCGSRCSFVTENLRGIKVYKCPFHMVFFTDDYESKRNKKNEGLKNETNKNRISNRERERSI